MFRKITHIHETHYEETGINIDILMLGKCHKKQERDYEAAIS